MSFDRPYLVGITGGIGSGKSTVCKIFQALEIPIYDADTQAKILINTDAKVRQAITKLLGEEAYKNGDYNRKFVAKEVFSDPKKLAKINAIVHPAVANDFSDWSKKQTSKYVLKEAALLFESGSYADLDSIITVTSPHDLRVKRVLNRDAHRSLEDVEAIINKQLPEEQKVALSDYVLVNDEQNLVIPQVLEIHQLLDSKIKR